MKGLFSIYKVGFYCLIIIVSAACKKAEWYNIKTDSLLAVPATFKDVQALLDHPSINASCPSIGEVGSDLHTALPSVVGDFSDTEHNVYTWSLERPFINVVDWSSGNLFDVQGPYP